MNGFRRPGEFCWINMITPETGDARAFFGELLGWTYEEMPGVGHLILVQGEQVGGLFDRDAPQTPPGTPPHIGVMVQVESADLMADAVHSLGGKALPPFDVFDQGRMAVCFDPLGANFDLWEPKGTPRRRVGADVPGAPSWFELLAVDVERVRPFYEQLFGWTSTSRPFPTFTYTMFHHEGQSVAGVLPRLPHMGNLPSHWGVYFTVEQAGATAETARKLGATVVVEPREIPGTGTLCGLESPQGVKFYAVEWSKTLV